MRPLERITLLVLLAFLTAPGHAASPKKKAKAFAREVRCMLKLEPQENLTEILPTTIPAPLQGRSPMEIFQTALGRLRSDLLAESDDLTRLLEALANADSRAKLQKVATKENLKRLLRWRKVTNTLRAAFRVCDKRHSVPRDYDVFTRDLGKLKDLVALLNKPKGRGLDPSVVTRMAKSVLRAFRDLDANALPGAFRAIGVRGFSGYVTETLAEISRRLEKDRLDAENFHEIRKQLRALKLIYDLVSPETLPGEGDPSDDSEQGLEEFAPPADEEAVGNVIAYLHALESAMGEVNDTLSRQRQLDPKFDYDHFVIDTPGWLKKAVREFIRRLPS